MTKLKTLPTMRDRKRYIFFRIHCKRILEYTDMRNAIWNSLLGFLGQEQLALAGVEIIKNMYKKDSGVIRCNHLYVDKVKVSLALIHQIGDERIIFQTLRVSGTIKAGKKKLAI